MELNEIKKELYKQKPTAYFTEIKSGVVSYDCEIDIITGDEICQYKTLLITFEIPVSEMGDTVFHDEMQAKHLIRWINLNNE